MSAFGSVYALDRWLFLNAVFVTSLKRSRRCLTELLAMPVPDVSQVKENTNRTSVICCNRCMLSSLPYLPHYNNKCCFNKKKIVPNINQNVLIRQRLPKLGFLVFPMTEKDGKCLLSRKKSSRKLN